MCHISRSITYMQCVHTTDLYRLHNLLHALRAYASVFYAIADFAPVEWFPDSNLLYRGYNTSDFVLLC